MTRRLIAVGLALALGGATVATAADRPELTIRPAEITAAATSGMILAATRAGGRVVAVGERGIVLLSDDGGASFRQARQVPVPSTLTAVSFADDKTGWAVGQWGVVIKTVDGGETWTLRRSDIATDRPLFSVLFVDANRGVAVGLWSLVLATDDGGATWKERPPPPPPGSTRSDLNLYAAVADGKGGVLLTAEGGKLLHADSPGGDWRYLDTGYKGSFWTGLALADGTLLVGGLRGTIYRSLDGGASWSPAATDAQSSVTGFAQAADGTVSASALDGVLLTSRDGGASFQSQQRENREALTAILARDGQPPLIFTKHGIDK